MPCTKRPGKFLLSLGLLGALACISEAAPPTQPLSKSSSQPTTNPQQASNQQLHQALQLLRSVHKTLEAADHDYGGHRVEAMHDIHAAEKQLREALEHAHKKHQQSGTTSKPSNTSTTKPSGTSATKGKSEPEPQQLSDQQLAQAVQELKQVASLLKTAEHDYGGHREKAVEDLEKAARQLEKALHYSKEHDQKQQ